MQLPYIAIIILHYKNLANTRECLNSLQKLDYPKFSVIIVNNDILEHKTTLKEEYGDFVKIIQNRQNLGFCEGNNVGIRAALADKKTDAVLLLNNDAVVDPRFLKEMVSVGADMTAPRMLDYNDHDKIDNLGIVLMSSGLTFNRRLETQKLFCPTGGCALYSRRLLECVVLNNPADSAGQNNDEYFDRAYFSYAEDLDLGWRARNHGFEPGYAKNAVVYHKGSAIHGKLSDFAVYHTYRNLIWTQFKNLPAALLLWQAPWLAFGLVFIFFYYLIKRRPSIIIKAYYDALFSLPMILIRRSKSKKKYPPSRQILSWFEWGLFPKNLLG